ncbi:serine hydrolase domain-containing protein [Sphingosinicella rhizophila]|uniref:Serine hydrolase domain-containing protein n=1 Tax=Sphingosinicella rhizophila TaxID=3050082 RepID=A0ABU3Q397_9SPHN|nr:serine hydrolase domain-containing protein [Sphingosinicella sp. GR2756]MDT9597881.1 serine hydrolase domain-containing protein [Sphingosinicella sp. GR2756]
MMIGAKPMLGLILLTAAAAIGAQVSLPNAPQATPEAAGTALAPSLDTTKPLARGTPIPADQLEAFVDGYVRQGMAASHVAGVTVGIVQNDRPILLKGYGIAGVDPVRPVDPRKSLFRIGSVSKTMTWIALLREVEKGRVKLDDPANKYLPPELQIPDQGFKRPIRVVDLMAHAPGMEDRALGHLFFDTSERLVPPADYLEKYRPDRVREAGALSTYSNYGVALAGEIVARLNGTDFVTVADREIFGPLQMRRSTFREPYEPRAGLPQPMSAALQPDVSSGFRWSGGRFQPVGFDFITSVASAGSISTTAEDMTRYMRLHLRNGTLEGTRIFGPESARLFRTPIMKVPEGVNGWAHGLVTSRLPGGFTGYGHGGGTTAFFTSMVLVPELDLGIFISTNTIGANAVSGPFAAAIVDRFYAGTPPVQRAGDPAFAEQGDDYAGTWVLTRRAYSGLEKFVGLTSGVMDVSVTPSGYLVTAGAGSPQSWVPSGTPGQFVAADGEDLLNFVLDKNGRPTTMYQSSGTNAYERSTPLMGTNMLNLAALLVLLTGFGLWVAFLARRAATSPIRNQRLSHYSLLGAAALWIASIISACSWFPMFGGPGRSMYNWPATPLLLGSILALAATLATIVAFIMMVLPRRGTGRAEAGWTVSAYVRQTLAILLFLFLALIVGMRGGLSPWA